MGEKQKTKNKTSGYWLLASSSRGVTTMMVVAFMGIFLIIMGTITSYAFQQAKYGRALYGREQAIAIAEAGLEYYRWFLAHFPNNLTNGTGLPGPYTYTVDDPEGGTLGSASISVTGNTECGVIQSIDITSQGTSNTNVAFKRTLFGRYMRKSVAAYSYLLNSSVWAGADRNITGPYFSNGGIRMDGSNNSDVLSPVSTWNCTSSYGCSPAVNPANGVLGSGTGSALWQWGANVSSIDFAGIGASLSGLKTNAQTGGGLYFAAAAGASSQRGYHLIFNSNGTVTVRMVSQTTGVPSYSYDTNDLSRYNSSGVFQGWSMSGNSVAATEYSIIKTEAPVAGSPFTIPSSCSLIFVEDRAWIEGVVAGKVTVVAATPSTGVAATTPTSAYLVGNITYASNDGTAGLTVIAEDSINIPLNSPDTMEIHGIFVAQGGLYMRNFYTNSSSYPSNYRVGATYASDVVQTQLTTVGSVVSNLRTGTSWVSSGVTTSGYSSRIDAYDQLQATDPPPFTPSASTDYSYVLWREQ